MLTLSEAMKTRRLQEFIAQEEARGVGPVDRAELDRALAKMVKAPRSEDQTSHHAMDRPESELAKVTVGIFRANVNMG
jgi:hypothetical protein